MSNQRNREAAVLPLMMLAVTIVVAGCARSGSDGLLQAARIQAGAAKALGEWEVSIAEVMEAPAGLVIHALDPVELYILESGGMELRMLGNRGEGPGEMLSPTGLISGSPEVFAVGSRGRSLHRIRDDGTLAADVTRLELPPRTTVRDVVAGLTYFGVQRNEGPFEEGFGAESGVIVRWSDPLAAGLDTIVGVQTGRGVTVSVDGPNGPGRMWFSNDMLPGDAWLATQDSSIWIVRSGGEVQAVRGDTVRSYGTLPAEVTVATAADLDSTSGYLHNELRAALLAGQPLGVVAGRMFRCTESVLLVQLRRRTVQEPLALVIRPILPGRGGAHFFLLESPSLGRIVGCGDEHVYLVEGREGLATLSALPVEWPSN